MNNQLLYLSLEEAFNFKLFILPLSPILLESKNMLLPITYDETVIKLLHS